MAEQDEDDYMSEVFVKDEQLPQKRKRVCRQIKKAPVKISKRLEEVRVREEGLSRPLAETNIGYEMLRKMGYKPGLGLGKEGTGRLDPVGIQSNEERQGVGRQEFVSERKKQDQHLKANQLLDFKERQRLIHSVRQVQLDLSKSQTACEQLDTTAGIEEPACYWYWKSTGITDESIDNEEPEPEVEEQLKLITEYLRSKYYYCTWCGVCFEDEHCLDDGCPGNSRSDHDT